MQEIREWFDGPLLLSGSIANGRSILAAQAMGADLQILNPRESGGEKVADLHIRHAGRLKGTSIPREIVPSLIDELPVLAVIAIQAEGVTTVTGADGSYTFDMLPPGDYTVDATGPDGTVATTDDPQSITLGPNQTVNDADFGYEEVESTIEVIVFNDADGDGMPDGWEADYGTNPLVNDALADPETEKFTNFSEFLNDTHPWDPDTDSGGVWDARAASATYRTTPDKESPLWNPHSQVIYWWTATEVDADRAYIIVYDGAVWPRSKQFSAAYMGFRCVKE